MTDSYSNSNSKNKIRITGCNGSIQNHKKKRENYPLLNDKPDSYGMCAESDLQDNIKNKKATEYEIIVNNNDRYPANNNNEYKGIAKLLDRYFSITERGSTIVTEIRGGTVGFLTLA
eukprot:883460_1